jgi:hypothetical protein
MRILQDRLRGAERRAGGVVPRAIVAVCCVALLGLPGRLQAQRDDRIDPAAAAGLAFLARQQADDGSFNGGAPRIAVTGIALLSYLSAGHTPEVGRYGLTVRRAVDYLLSVAPADGYVGRIDGSRMYGQAIVTLALAEAYGAEPDPQQRVRLRGAVELGVEVILRAQRVDKALPHTGGWRYEPQSADSDLSVTGWCVQALRAARNIGVDVPQESFDSALAYAMRCYRAEPGGFAYQPQGEVTRGVTAVGITMLCLFDDRDAPAVAASAKLLARPPGEQSRFVCSTLHSAGRASMLLGGAAGAELFGDVRDILLRAQSEDGGWPSGRSGDEPGRVFSTSMAVMTLCAPRRVLNVFEK